MRLTLCRLIKYIKCSMIASHRLRICPHFPSVVNVFSRCSLPQNNNYLVQIRDTCFRSRLHHFVMRLPTKFGANIWFGLRGRMALLLLHTIVGANTFIH